MVTSLYAIGPSKIEVGKYRMELPMAIETFRKQCESVGCKLEIGQYGAAAIADITGDTLALLQAVANIRDLHGDPPDRYLLVGETDLEWDAEYVKTGRYND